MLKSSVIFYCFCCLLLHSSVWAQIITSSDVPIDSIQPPIEIIEKKEDKDRSGFNRLMRKIFIKKNSSTEHKSDAEDDHFSYALAQGKFIRNIYVNTRKPFGYSITDSTKQPEERIERIGNALHVKSKSFAIKNYLIQKEGERFDSLKIMESERLIRRQRFTRKVKIEYVLVDEFSDSVDLHVQTLDSWTIFPNITYSGSKIGFRLRERNFMGFGHDFDNYYRQNLESGRHRYQTRYTIPNIRQTYIGLSLSYGSNEENEYTKGISVQRRFFSPLTRWAGGATISQTAYRDSIPNDFGALTQDFKYNLQDYWAAIAFPISSKLVSKNRLTNLIISARYFHVDYNKKPDKSLDPIHFYANEDFFLMAIGLSKRGFAKDRFIQNYNIIEDIPTGMSLGLTTGMQRKNERDRFYLAGGLKMGDYFKLGYLGFELQYGGFLNGKYSEQSVFSLSTSYFTRLMSWDRWRFRNFISSHLIIGNNRADSRGDRLTLNENDPLGIDGFNSLEVIGTKKWLTNVQIQSYSPYQLLGFRISPILSSSFGLISDYDRNLLSGKLYARVGLGVLLTNDYWVFSNFQLSFSWYNSIPGAGDNLFKTNTHQISDYELMDFDFGKPELIEYNPFVTH